VTSFLPRLRGNGGHRADDRIAQLEDLIAQLRDENATHLNRQAAIDDYIKILQGDRNDVYAAWQFAEHGRQAAEAIVVDQERQIRDLKRQLGEAKRRLEVGVLAEAAAAQTQELDLRTLQERFAEGPVVALNQTPQARRSPDHVPGWVKDQPTT
jgi:chromosome segregation ATPase